MYERLWPNSRLCLISWAPQNVLPPFLIPLASVAGHKDGHNHGLHVCEGQSHGRGEDSFGFHSQGTPGTRNGSRRTAKPAQWQQPLMTLRVVRPRAGCPGRKQAICLWAFEPSLDYLLIQLIQSQLLWKKIRSLGLVIYCHITKYYTI